MPAIMISCRTFGTPVPTGLTTETIKFESLSGMEIRMRCPACLKHHRWQRKDAWIEGANPNRNPRVGSAWAANQTGGSIIPD
jgi:hypothetical protein